MESNIQILVPDNNYDSGELSIEDVEALLDDLEEADPMLAGIVVHTEDDVEPPDGFKPLRHALADQLAQLEAEFENERVRWRRIEEQFNNF